MPVYKLLGVTINCTIKWDDHVATVVDLKAENTYGLDSAFQSTTLYVTISL